MSLPLAFGMPGAPEMFIILIIVLVLFGAKKIPEFARSLGKATKEFKEAKSAFNDAVHAPPEVEEPKHNIAPPAEEEELEVDSKPEEKSEKKAEAKEEAQAKSDK
ncbi:MAG: twin-arginine translocase TatA/TatE family subunit [Lentisphaeraceae bacterium]|nr:twin-arginine translocase TatA/TatE family subunit [Lentisphaeraceae bacterium]